MRVSFNSRLTALSAAAFLLLSAAPETGFAGAWVPAVGGGYNKLAINYFDARDSFGGESASNQFTNTNLSYYGEYGIADNLGIFGSIALTRLTQSTDEARTDFFGVGDLDLGFRYNLINGPFVLSTSFLFKVPYLYEQNTELPPGNGQEDFDFRLLFGKGLNRFGYFGFEIGYRLRLEEPSDEIRYLVEYGFSATDNLYFRTKFDIIQSVRNGDEIPTGIGNPALNPEFDLARVELTTGWNFDRSEQATGGWGAEVTFTHDFWGRNTLQGNTVQLGLTYAY